MKQSYSKPREAGFIHKLHLRDVRVVFKMFHLDEVRIIVFNPPWWLSWVCPITQRLVCPITQ